MKRVLALVLTLMLLVPSIALADARTVEVCFEIAAQFDASFDGSNSLSAKASFYDSSLNAIVLRISSNHDHEFYNNKRLIGDIQPLYDMFADFNAYQFCKQNMDKYSISDVDVYLLLYSSDDVLEYIEVNGRNITNLVSTMVVSDDKTPDTIMNAFIEQYNTDDILAFGEYIPEKKISFFARAFKSTINYDLIMSANNIDEIIALNIQISKDLKDALVNIGEDEIQAYSALYTYDGRCVNVAVDGIDRTEDYGEIVEGWVKLTY